MDHYATDDTPREPLTLCWNGQPLDRITEANGSDWPWASGKLEMGELPADLRAVLEWFSRQADSDNLEDPPFHERLLEHWSIVADDGGATEIDVPGEYYSGKYNAEDLQWSTGSRRLASICKRTALSCKPRFWLL